MAYGIFVFFAPPQETLIKGFWQIFAETEIAPRLYTSGHRPHITLAVYQQLALAPSTTLLRSLARQIQPFEITFSNLGFFPGKKPVLILTPHISTPLINLHSRVHEIFDPQGTPPFVNYTAERWTPHCTLAKNVHLPDIHRTLDIGLQLSLPLTCRVEHIGLVEYPQVIHHAVYPLGHSTSP